MRNLLRYRTREQLESINSSRKDGIDANRERNLRNTNLALIDDSAQLLKLPGWTIYTARIFHHKFFATHSMKRNCRFLVSTACLFLAGKVNDTPRALDDVLWACHSMRYKKNSDKQAQFKDPSYVEKLKDDVLTAERAILYAIGFDFNVELPHSYIIKKLDNLGILKNPNFKQFVQVTVNFATDRYCPEIFFSWCSEMFELDMRAPLVFYVPILSEEKAQC